METPDGVVTSSTLLRELCDPHRKEEAWEAFLGLYQPMIYNWCCRWGLRRDDAEEVSAIVVAKLVQVMKDFVYDPSRRFRGWLKTVVGNEVKLWLRHRKRHPDCGTGNPLIHRQLEEAKADHDIDDLVRELDAPLEHDLKQAQEVVGAVRKRVKAPTWEAFWRTAIDDEPPGEVAHQLGMSVAAVYMARWRVGQLLQQEGQKLRSQAPPGNEGES
jgi:RNA polymerase sigma-70 factor (ECF subfamily)